MNKLNWTNRITAFVVFAIAMLTYGLTIEPTASFWDCSEFITTAFKMEVGHPPGAPFFMLTGKFFSLFASSPAEVARMINLMSAFCSALTILFLFLTITHLMRKVVLTGTAPDFKQILLITASGAVGALAYTFSDTFWFSAVEGEVYAYSSLLTAVVFWLILKWEDHAHEAHSDRFLVLIFYIMGISVGVHLLNLLTIPAIVLVYYFKKYSNPNWKGALVALMVSCFILAAILYGMIPGFITQAGYIELLFVNTFGLPFNSGALAYCAITVLALLWSIIELYRNQPNINRIKCSSLSALVLLGVPFLGGSLLLGILIIAALIGYFVWVKDRLSIRLASTIMVSMAMLLLGYSCYAVIVVRSVANPPMDQNSPDNVFSLKTYLNREQYGDRPLLYGAYYSAEPELISDGQYCRAKTKEGDKTWGQKEKTQQGEKDSYEVTSTRYSVCYESKFKTLFPRMHSSSGDHPKRYEEWVDIKGKKVDYDQCGRNIKVKVPTFAENMEFFFKYQLHYMYWRYFMWNFAGRQNDIQGHGEVTYGNWISGFNAIDSAMLGDQSTLPAAYANNKGHNAYYLLPLILGILGMAYQWGAGSKGKQTFWVTLVLFFMTGIAIVLYLNQGPAEPRERDYAYAGSFYAFAIWIGIGVAGLSKILQSCKLPEPLAVVLAVLLSLPVPALMASENWDDHDRSNRYVARDFGLNYFQSCDSNAIIFTNGDNDTFPLWYTQDTEGTEVSLDKRVCNLSYLQTDWYIDQMRRPAYKSAGLPIAWERKDYVEGKNSLVYMYNLIDKVDLKWALDNFLLSDDINTKHNPVTNSVKEYLPSKVFTVPVNVQNLIKQGAILPQDSNKVLREMVIDLSHRSYLTKSDLMILDMIANNNWERPIYYAVTVGSEQYLGLQKYFQLEGLCYRIVPYKNAASDGTVATDKMFDNMMHKFKFGNVSDPKVYLDENVLRMCMAQRQMFEQMIGSLINEGKKEQAAEAVEYCLKVLPGATVPHTYSSTDFVEFYYLIDQRDKALEFATQLAEDADAKLAWLTRLPRNKQMGATRELALNLACLQQLAQVVQRYDAEAIGPFYDKFVKYEKFYSRLH